MLPCPLSLLHWEEIIMTDWLGIVIMKRCCYLWTVVSVQPLLWKPKSNLLAWWPSTMQKPPSSTLKNEPVLAMLIVVNQQLLTHSITYHPCGVMVLCLIQWRFNGCALSLGFNIRLDLNLKSGFMLISYVRSWDF